MAAARRRTPKSTTANENRSTETLTVGQLCAELGVARSTFYEWRTRTARALARAQHCPPHFPG